MALGNSWIISTIQVGDGIIGQVAQHSTNGFRDRFVLMVLLQSSRRCIQNGFIATAKNHLTSNGQCNGIFTGFTVNNSQDGIRCITES